MEKYVQYKPGCRSSWGSSSERSRGPRFKWCNLIGVYLLMAVYCNSRHKTLLPGTMQKEIRIRNASDSHQTTKTRHCVKPKDWGPLCGVKAFMCALPSPCLKQCNVNTVKATMTSQSPHVRGPLMEE